MNSSLGTEELKMKLKQAEIKAVQRTKEDMFENVKEEDVVERIRKQVLMETDKKKNSFAQPSYKEKYRRTLGTNTFEENFFWSREKLKSIQERIKKMAVDMKEKVKQEMAELKEFIRTNNENEILILFKDPTWRRIYKTNINAENILMMIFEHGMPEVLQQLLSYDEFNFENTFIFQYVEKILLRETKKIGSLTPEELVSQAVTSSLYNKDIERFIAFIVGSCDLSQAKL